MKITKVAITASAFFLFGLHTPLYARDQGHDNSAREPKEHNHGQPEHPGSGHEKSAPPQHAIHQPQAIHQGKPHQEQPPHVAHQPQSRQLAERPAPRPRAHQPRVQQPEQREQQPQQQARPPQQRVQPAPQEHAQREQTPQLQPSHTEQQARQWQQQQGWRKGSAWHGSGTWRQGSSSHWASEHRTWAQRGGYRGYYIPEIRFRAVLGRQHLFRLHVQPVIYLGYPRFEYAGFTFLLVDPWPDYWSLDWYDDDDLYIVYDDGYYLCDVRYPQIMLALVVLR
jgi:hypothetical protein